MNTHDVIMKEDNDIFHMSPDGPVHMPCVGIEDISFMSLDSAKTILIAHTPSAIKYLSEIPSGATLEVVNGCSGRLRNEYTVENVIVRLGHCVFRERWFPNLVAIRPEDAGRIALYAEATCKLELLLA